MTTEVIVKANHGWPVVVVPVFQGGIAVGPTVVVDPGAERSVYVFGGQDLLVHEVQPDAAAALGALVKAEPILQFFAFVHLPEPEAAVSRPFWQVAVSICGKLPRNPERTVALRRLLEAKDAAVRAALPPVMQDV